MIKLKRLKATFSIIIGFLLLSTFFNSAYAWSNGSYAYNETEYSYEDDYGTHDWIAERALNVLLNYEENEWNWLESRKEIFLVGTEAPDNGGVSMTLDGKNIDGFGDTTWHHIYFNQDGSISNNEDDSALRAKSMGDLADANLEEKNLDLAAFYLGAMTHYIADMGMYAHVAENNVAPHFIDFDEHHSTIEGYVQTRTNEYDDKEEFFLFLDITLGTKSPYNAAVDLAWDTYNDSSNNFAHNALWLHNNFFSGWELNYEDRSSDTSTHQEYYDRIETNLNNAIEACASAMNYVGGYESSSSDDDDDDDDNINEPTTPSYPFIVMAIFISFGVMLTITKLKNKRIKNF